MPFKPIKIKCKWCGNSVMADPRSRFCGRSCVAKYVNSIRDYAKGEKHYNFKHCGRERYRKEYFAWRNMINRCCDPDCSHYKNYGGRGITIYPEWQSDFISFLNYVGCAPSKSHSIERKNNDGNYEPGNVEWATKLVQSRNRRSNRWIEHGGERMVMADWAKLFRVESSALLKMIKKYSFSYIYDYYKSGKRRKRSPRKIIKQREPF